MAEKMLIDASHPEETRVVVVRGNRIEEFDFESEHKKQLRGNIYLAKVTRVEPSLQAAFVDYGGNRHGFLAFSEIHPDYYQIPLADRQALLQAEAEDAENDPDFESADEADTGPAKSRSKSKSKSEAKTAEDEEGSEDGKSTKSRPRRSRRGKKTADPAKASDDAAADDADATSNEDTGSEAGAISADELAAAAAANETDAAAGTEAGKDDDDKPTEMAADVEADEISEPVSRRKRKSNDDDDASGDDESVESVGSEDAMEEVPTRSQRKPRKQYRIQEVIKRRQILLVQVVKEERGNKGAALDNLPVAGRALFGADAKHRPRWWHFAQDHQSAGPQAAQGNRTRARGAEGHGRHPAYRRRQPHQGRGQARFRIPDAAVGERPQSDAQVDRRRASSTRKAA
jgi:ribonuclease E